MKFKLKLKLALRSILRHRLRSILSICMIAGSIASMVIFRGFSQFALGSVKLIAAENQYGHMQVAKNKYWNPGSENRKERLLNLEEISSIQKNNSSVEKIAGRLSFFGLVSNGDSSTSAKFIGIDTVTENKFSKTMKVLDGKFFNSSDAKEAMIGSVLAKQMHLKAQDNITVLTSTIDGVMNAMDLSVTGIYTAGIDEIDAKVIYLPLSITQQLLDTKNVDVAVLKFKKLEMAEKNADKINSFAKLINPEFLGKTWRDLSLVFRQTSKFYAVQNKIVEGILLTLMFLGILNSVSMTVVERTGEIGILRSLGESRKDIIRQFILESLIIAFIGIITGAIASYLMIQLIHAANIITDMPGASVPFQIRITFMYYAVIYATFCSVITTMIATIIPAYHASRLDIVEALRKNI
jgi:putative ABC transport system permease protein